MTKNWFGKMCLLGLVALVPVFGAIVVQGYLYGWARDAAWKMENPLPGRLLGNEDGRLYRRGLFAVVIAFVIPASVVVGALVFICASAFVSAGMSAMLVRLLPDAVVSGLSVLSVPSSLGMLALSLAFFAAVFGVQFFVWVGSMRMSIYGTLSSGFQISRAWAMIRRNPGGLFKIALGQTAALVAIGAFMSMLWCIVLFVIAFASLLAAGSVDYSGSYGPAFGGLAAMGTIATVLLALFVVYASVTASVAVQAFACRALGHWTSDFEVADWGSQDEPMPFELARESVVRDAGR